VLPRRRDLGTALHSIIEKSWGDDGHEPPAAYAADVRAVHAALAAAGLRVVEGMAERVIVHDGLRIAGTFDLMVADAEGTRYIADIKTGASVTYRRPRLRRPARHLRQRHRARHPGRRRQRRRGSPRADARRVEGSGTHHPRRAGEWALRAPLARHRHWRRGARAGHGRARDPQGQAAHPDRPHPHRRQPPRVDLWPHRRHRGPLRRGHPGARTSLARRHPPSRPARRRPGVGTEHLDAIEAVVVEVSAEHGVAFPDALAEAPKPRAAETPRRPLPDEGDDAPAEDVEALQRRVAELEVSERAWVMAVAASAKHAGRPITLKDKPSQRRWLIVRALWRLATVEPNDDVLRQLVGAAMGEEVQPGVSLGLAVGSLTIAEAERLGRLIDALGGALSVAYDPDGAIRVVGDLAAVAA